MAREFINPNLHAVLLHAPLGLLVVGTLIEVFSFLGWRRTGLRIGGRWMIYLGSLLLIPTAYSGLYALSDVVRMHNPAMAGDTWHATLETSPLASAAGHGESGMTPWEMAQRHAWLNAIATALVVLAITVWVAGSDLWRARMYLPVLLLFLAGVAAMLLGGWYGGEMVYQSGVAVETPRAILGAAAIGAAENAPAKESVATPPLIEAMDRVGVPVMASTAPAPATTAAATQAVTNVIEESRTEAATTETSAEGGQSIAAEVTVTRLGLERYVDPLQLHVIAAGLAVALAMAALGLSLRVANTVPVAVVGPAPELTDVGAAFGARPRGALATSPDPYALDALGGAARLSIPPYRRLPAGRFWVLASLCALLAALAGWWTLAYGRGSWDFEGSWALVKEYSRRLFHVGTGAAIIVLPLILAILVRFAPRKRGLTFLLALVLIAAVAAQTWFGILLMWDGAEGPLMGFNQP